MRSQALRHSLWVSAVFCAALTYAPGTPAAHAAEDGVVGPMREAIERLRAGMERAFLDVSRDHVRVREPDWAQTPLSAEFGAVLDAFAASIRERAKAERGPDGAVPGVVPNVVPDDGELAGNAIRDLERRRTEAPLTRTSLLPVLAELARDLGKAESSSGVRPLFFAAAVRVFAATRAEDAWDARFLSLSVVAEFRAANARLAEAEGRVANAPAADAPVEKTDAESAAKPLDDAMILCDKLRPWLGPWTGWTSDLPESKNKRQQRAAKVVWIDRFEVTCEQYRAFLLSLGPASRRAMLPAGWTLDEKDEPTTPPDRGRHPVTGVTWRQAQAYAESHGKRLPTCDEWERAAAGGEKEPRIYPWGASDGKSWARLGVEPKGTFPVDAFPDDVTPDGIFGMAGNVAEMVFTYPDRTEIGKSGPEKDRQLLVCGGSYASRASECTTSWRWAIDRDKSSPSIGFRCVMDDAEYKKRKK